MLSDREKKEMLEDGLSGKRRRSFVSAHKKRPKTSTSLDRYIGFLMGIQKIKPFEIHSKHRNTSKNLL